MFRQLLATPLRVPWICIRNSFVHRRHVTNPGLRSACNSACACDANDCHCRRQSKAARFTNFAGLVAGTAILSAPGLIIPRMSILHANGALVDDHLVIDLNQIAEGATFTTTWAAQSIFIRHRTAAEIAAAQSTPMSDLPDPQPDSERVQLPEWLILIGECTHMGCIPMTGGDYGGFICPCHDSHFDTSGRARHGPARTNLPLPHYHFSDNNTRVVIRHTAPCSNVAESLQ
eukprot:TRINITY_DN4231_c0_g1_i3.p1 TRINITY_DN4231_c0_g1~~TRINITY_DN4231_c0_g1_i3.p1  ORF type:complete len:231 (-),score=7.36 TRINITY_DN4231_c0_g1_i3:4-696(-)